MLYNGSSGNTRAEMVKALMLEKFSESDINVYYQEILQALIAIDPTTDLIIANSIWYRNYFPVKSAFIETGKKYFDAEVKALNFKDASAANTINKWCADKTKNRINHIVSAPIPDSMMMILVNALYFKSKWKKEIKFDKAKTKLDDFTKINGQKIKANLMEQTTFLPYYADQKLQCVELPYGNMAFSMIAVLPDNNIRIDQLIEHLATVEWQNIVDSMRQQKVWLKLPRFKIECDLSLNQPVMNLGMTQLFNGKLADFANISDTVMYVSEIKQKTFVEVNEEGTEASAVTLSGMLGGRISNKPQDEEPVRFFADRPFLFLIREKSTGIILFIGRIDEPRE
jgi:serpin B